MNDDRLFKLLKLIINILALLPRKVLKFFSDLLGLIWYRIDKRHRNVVIENITAAYPGRFSLAQSQRFTKIVFKNIASIPFEVIWSYRKTKDELFKYFVVKGIRHLENAKKKNRGVILLGGHIGNFELLVASVAKAGIKPCGIYRKFDFEPLERLLLEERQRFGTQMIPLRGASKKINAVLQNKGIIATLLDQNVDWYKGVFVNYFGRPACTNNGFAKLALKSKAVVVPMFIVKKNDQYIMEFLPEIPLQETGDPIKDIENNTQNYVSAIESMIRQCPEQYFWVHNRWKTKPYCLLNNI
ncbi:MAG: lysophospholipid acyltransferase family protein [Proteobacteria bacterium]|nr:lysophospholipid acyltransferase family protein [Pseudomonadota bacterium]MBU1581311.1 lysophospholipid acyltransferase family protein [Pseudomonadota bacterium]MBU2631180.1 lysophospholipid acyltransferase family protein [Pseudomonadota bacterium]